MPRSAGPVAEEHAGIAVGPVHNTAQSLGADDQHILGVARQNVAARHGQCVDEAGAGSTEVKSACIDRANSILHDAGCGREEIFRRARRADDQIHLAGVDIGYIKGFSGCGCG